MINGSDTKKMISAMGKTDCNFLLSNLLMIKGTVQSAALNCVSLADTR